MEELRSIPRSSKAKAKEGSRVTISSSHLYAEAVKKYYAQFTRHSEPLTPPPTNPRAQLAPFPHLSPLNPILGRSSSSASASQVENGNSDLDVDFIDLSEDHEDILFWAVVWEGNGLKYKTALLSPNPNEAGRFSLASLKVEMGENDIEQTQILEAYGRPSS